MFKRILKFFNLVDRSGNLSISNITVIVLIVKIAVASTLDWAIAASLLVTLMNYGHKRIESNKAIKADKEADKLSQLEQTISEQTSKLESFSQEIAKSKELNELITKQSDETKKLLSNSNLANAFKPRT